MLIAPSIQLARAQDADRIAQIARECDWRSTECGWHREYVLGAIASASTNVAVAHVEEVPVGFAIMSYGVHHARLNFVAVAASSRRLGIGACLVRWLERCAITAGVAAVRVKVRAGQAGAQAFYRRLGYDLADPVAEHHRRDLNAISLEKTLRNG